MADKTYLIETHDATYKIDIPEEWKITFGPVAIGGGGKRQSYDYSGGSMALRIYESDTKQRAIFTGVQSFRDLSIPVKKLVVREKGSHNWENSKTKKTSNSSTELEYSWEEESDGTN